ncbi:MAG: serine hydrolase domain-containing protein [Cyanobacteriota bacterium]|nr:serine hydrolase domain-containing protein [Cyanobacteriota bacterium]
MTEATKTSTQTTLSEKQLAEFKKKFEERRKFYRIPGAALGIVQNGQVVVSEGFGLRDLDSKAPVTPKTIFAIGSMSKSLTAFMIGTQIDEGLYNWNTKVNEISSAYEFPLQGNEVITVADLLNMHSGIEGGVHLGYINIEDNIFTSNAAHWNDQTPIYVIKNISYLPAKEKDMPKEGTKGKYFYNNELFASAGYLTPLKNKKPTSRLLEEYNQLMQNKVFQPLGMKCTRITGTLSSISNDYAISYGIEVSGGKAKIFEKGGIGSNYINGLAPAGQVASNVEDMNRYLITLLNDGLDPEKKTQAIETKTLEELWKIENHTLQENTNNEGITGKVTYGMGWWVEEIPIKSNSDEKVTVLHHGGFLPSWACMQMLVPDRNAGIVILTNGCFGREFTMEMNQEMLKLLYEDIDTTKFIDNEAYHNKFVTKLETTIAKKVSSEKIERDKVKHLLGNYEGGWSLEHDEESSLLVLYKNGWIYHLALSREKKYVYYIVASNDHRGMKVKQPKEDEDEYTEGKIWFTKERDEMDVDGIVLMMSGLKVGEINKLPEESKREAILHLLADRKPSVAKYLEGRALTKLYKAFAYSASTVNKEIEEYIKSANIDDVELVEETQRKMENNFSIATKILSLIIASEQISGRDSRHSNKCMSHIQTLVDRIAENDRKFTKKYSEKVSSPSISQPQTIDASISLNNDSENEEPLLREIPNANETKIEISLETTLESIRETQLD